MMNAHVEQREPLIGGKKGLPVRYCAHLDRSQDRRSQFLPVEQLLKNGYRWIEPHVLVDRLHLVRCRRFFNTLLGATTSLYPCFMTPLPPHPLSHYTLPHN